MEDEWDAVAAMPPTNTLREQIRQQTEVFLRNGGRIRAVGSQDNAEAQIRAPRTRAQALDDMKRSNYRYARR